MARFHIRTAAGEDSYHELAGEVTTLGRSSANDLVLPGDQVSRLHALLRRVGESYILTDRGSTNGVRVNGEALAGERRLTAGDTVEIGENTLVFEVPDEDTLQFHTMALSREVDNFLSHAGALRRPATAPMETLAEADPTARLAELERENFLLSILHDANLALQNCGTTSEIVERFMEQVFHIKGAERCFLMLLDGEQGGEDNWRQTPIYTRAALEIDAPAVIFSRSILRRIKEEKQPILIRDLGLDARFSATESICALGMRSAMCIPMLSQGRLVGVLYADNPLRPEAFTQEETNILTLVASQAAAALENHQSRQQIQRQKQQRAALERFLAPEVVELIAADPESARLGGGSCKASVLFADIRGFTALSEKMEPGRVLEMLNEYFTHVADIIFDNGGTLDKFMGDGVMAIFGAPLSKGEDAVNAVRAALEIQKLSAQLSQPSPGSLWPSLHIGVGINTGIVTAGNIGSPKRLDYTVIGDTVNVASRLCGQAAGGQVLISQSTAEELGSHFELRALEPVQLKGKSQPVNVFELAAEKNSG